jgi:uncharacterized protein (TIGR03083 family)
MKGDPVDTWEMIDAERTAFADLADSLTPEQWETQSLCAAWKVRDVVAHVTEGSTLGTGETLLAALRYGFRINRMLEREAIKDGAAPTDELRKNLRATVGRRTTPIGVKPPSLLDDIVTHQQDVRRAIQKPRDVPAEHLRVALDDMAGQKTSILPVKKAIKGLKLRATDIDFSFGDGPEVTGPGEALLLGIGGRAAALDDLSGPGVAILRERLTK